MILNKIIWEPSSTIFSIGNFGIHYYSLMFVLAFTIGYYLMKRMFNMLITFSFTFAEKCGRI